MRARTSWKPVLLVALMTAFGATARAQSTNSWTDGSGKWETAANWSQLTAPTNTDAADVITNAGNNTVTIDATTSGSFPGTMTVTNITLSGFASNTNTLSVIDAFFVPLHVLSQLVLGNNGALVMNNSEVDVDGNVSVGASGTGNQLTVTNGAFLFSGTTVIGGVPGSNNNVQVTDSGIWEIDGNLNVRNSTPGIAIKVAEGGALWVTNSVILGNSASADGNVVVVTDPGSFWENDGPLTVGGSSHGAQFIISNAASALSSSVVIGDPVGNSHSAMVTGTDSFWQVNSTIQIGNGGTNDSLTISDAGSLAAAQVRVNGAALILNGGTFSTASLVVTNGGVVQYAQSFKVDNATVSVASGTVQASSNLVVATAANSTGTVNVTGGQLVVTNGVFGVGNSGTLTSGAGVGTVTVSNGTALVSTVLLGSSTGGAGDMTIKTNGVVSFDLSTAGTNTVLVVNDLWLDGGLLSITNGTIFCGRSHAGTMTMSNGTAFCQDIYVGWDYNGDLAIDSGAMTLNSILSVGYAAGATGQVWVSGGQLLMTNPNLPTVIGGFGVGQLTISNGSVQAPRVVVSNAGNAGTLTVAGGSLTANLLINPNGRFSLGQGQLISSAITNANGQVFVVGDGVSAATLTLAGGYHSFDNGLQISVNASLTGCGTITGTVVNYGTVLADCGGPLTFTGVVTNNGVLRAVNGSVLEFYGTLVNNGVIDIMTGTTDFHGAFINNGAVVDTSSFQIATVAREGNNIRVTWTTVGGRSYVVQTNAPPASGGYTNNFADFSSTITIPGLTTGTTNYLDVGGAIGVPARYYRVRLVP